MLKRQILSVLLLALFSLSGLAVLAQEESAAPLMDDFETETLFMVTDEFNNAIGHAPWGDTLGNVQLSLKDVERDGVAQRVLAINYDIGSWGGFTHALNDGTNWISQDWTAFNALQFSLYGNNTGGVVQVEIFDNRNPGLNTDTAERWFYRINDDYEGWQDFVIPFDNFQRRTDFQPGGAPNDGLGLNAVSGYAFGMPGGVGAQEAYLDNVTVSRVGVEPIIVDDFEVEELFVAQDSLGNNIGYVPWGDTANNVSLRLTDAARSGTATRALTIAFDIAAWGGFSHVFNDGTNWVGQDWTAYNTISFWYLGSNTGTEIQFEIFDNLNPDAAGDSAERWFYRFVDDSYSWKLLEIPFTDFQRRSDYQPNGALDDGFNLNAVSGYAFGMPAGIGSKVHFVDDMRVVAVAGVEQPEGVVIAEEPEATAAPVREAAVLSEVVPNEALLAPLEFAEPILLSDFEMGLPYVTAEGTAIGYVPWGDTTGNVQLGTALVQPFTALAMPEQSDFNQVFRIDYNISAWGGFNYGFTDGEAWLSQDWTKHNAIQFWLYGNNTGQIVQVELFDNRAPDTTGDTAERYYYQMLDNYAGWAQVTMPFALFQRRTDWQPGGAPDDGFNLTEVNGYAIGFPAGVGAQSAYVDDVQVVVVENPSEFTLTGQAAPEVTTVEIDESITWDSREWELLWSDEFDIEAGTPLNTEYWTCETGASGWGNNELQNYTQSTDNVAHDGNGNLVITAMGNETDGYTSGRCITRGKMEFTYGRVEARIKIPRGQGIWPAFWMLGANFGQVGWPSSGEIDILENIGKEPNIVHGTIHGPGYSGGSGIGNSYHSDVPFADDFHIYAIDWDPYVIRWYVDGNLFSTISVNTLLGNRWVFDHDFFLLLNVAVGGNWPGYPDETTVFPQQMLVDYVRVYQLGD